MAVEQRHAFLVAGLVNGIVAPVRVRVIEGR